MGTNADGPVGTWAEHFRLDGRAFDSTLHFTPTGKVFILSGPAPGGGGAGTWESTGTGGFAYRIFERLLDDNGNFAGWVDIDHRAVLDGDVFTSTGISTVYDVDDRVQHDVRVDGEAVRR